MQRKSILFQDTSADNSSSMYDKKHTQKKIIANIKKSFGVVMMVGKCHLMSVPDITTQQFVQLVTEMATGCVFMLLSRSSSNSVTTIGALRISKYCHVQKRPPIKMYMITGNGFQWYLLYPPGVEGTQNTTHSPSWD